MRTCCARLSLCLEQAWSKSISSHRNLSYGTELQVLDWYHKDSVHVNQHQSQCSTDFNSFQIHVGIVLPFYVRGQLDSTHTLQLQPFRSRCQLIQMTALAQLARVFSLGRGVVSTSQSGGSIRSASAGEERGQGATERSFSSGNSLFRETRRHLSPSNDTSPPSIRLCLCSCLFCQSVHLFCLFNSLTCAVGVKLLAASVSALDHHSNAHDDVRQRWVVLTK